MPDVGAIILAAGGSSRFGRPKQFALIEGIPLIRRVVNLALEFDCNPIVVVTGRDYADCKTALHGSPAEVVSNSEWEAGMGGSLRVGATTMLSHAAVDHSWILLGDQPAITPETLRTIAAAQAATHHPVAIADFNGTIGPPACITRAVLEELQVWPDSAGAKALWERAPDRVLRVPCPEAAIDIDTPEDLDRFDGRRMEK